MARLFGVAPLIALAVSVCLAPACKNKKGKATPQGKPVEATHPTETTTPPAAEAKPETNEPPTIELPVYDIVGVGQEVGFGIEVIDLESDEIAIELVTKPESATFDPYTLTVVWKPSKADLPLGEFAAKVTETRRDTGEVRVNTHHFSIAVSARPQPMPIAKPLGAAVETLITIHDPERLALANKEWPLDAMLEAAARSAHSDLAEAEQKANSVPDRAKLYETFLHNIAKAHHNKTLEPSAPEFDKATWGDPADWKIIAIRPRLDKKWHEVRIVYKAKAHAATYTMFKFRPFADSDAPTDGLALNNAAMAKLVVESFFTEGGALDGELMRDKGAHAKRVAAFLNKVINYESPEHSWHSATFLGLPTEARLGGGNKRKPDGTYASGDAWGWNVMKAKPKDGQIIMKNIPIKGFMTAVAKSADGKSWEMRCGAKFDPNSDAHDPRFVKLCRKTGHVDLPASGDGYSEGGSGPIVSSLVDAANMFVDYKETDMVATLPLRDPRRDLFEEKGMTCSQCHVRKFGVRDFYDPGATDPSAGEPRALNKKQDTTYFVITPTERWRPYAIDFQYKQECKFKEAIKKAIGLETSLGCPLRSP